MSKILVTGGAGYIGSHTVMELLTKGHDVFIFDSLYTGHKEAAEVQGLTQENGKLIIGDLLNIQDIEDTFSKHNFDAVIHFAALSLVGESISNPIKYYENNVTGTVNLLKVMQKYKVQNIVFSSTAASYGNPDDNHTNDGKIPEEHPNLPINPYGKSKLAIEWLLKDCTEAWGLQATALRYFNAAGNNSQGIIGELHIPESHLIPIVFGSEFGRPLQNNKEFKLVVNGDDYDTPDGTCVRDYIHVDDLATAHVLAVEKNASYLSDGDLDKSVGKMSIYNIGTGRGYSIMEVIRTIESVLGKEVAFSVGERRQGDPATLVADPSKINQELGWVATRSSLESIMQDVKVWTEILQGNGWQWIVEN